MKASDIKTELLLIQEDVDRAKRELEHIERSSSFDISQLPSFGILLALLGLSFATSLYFTIGLANYFVNALFILLAVILLPVGLFLIRLGVRHKKLIKRSQFLSERIEKLLDKLEEES